MGIFSQMVEKKEEAVVDVKSNQTQPLEAVEPATGIDDVVADQTGVGKQEPPPVEPRHVRTVTMEEPERRAVRIREQVFALKGVSWETLGDAGYSALYGALLTDIKSAAIEGALSVEEGAALLNKAIADRQLAIASVALGFRVHLDDVRFVALFKEHINGSNAESIRVNRDYIVGLRDGSDCSEPMVEAVKEKLDELILLCNLELTKLEKLNRGADEIIAAPKPASTPPAPAQELTGKTHDTPDAVRAADTAEVNAVLDKLPADPGASTVASQASPPTGPQEDSRADEAQTGIMAATDRSITRATPIPPPRSDTDLASPDDVVSMDAVTTTLRIVDPYDLPPATPVDPAAAMLAATPPAPSAGPTPPEPDADLDLAFAPTAAHPITPAEGMLVATAAETTPEPIPQDERQLIFRIVQGNGLVRTVNLVEPMIKVGKLPSSHLRLDDDKVSRMHAIIENEGDEVFVIDLGSSNGTLVNGTRVNKTTLRNNDVLQFGDTIVKLEISQVQAETPAPTDSAHTPPLGGMGRDTNVGNPTDVSAAPAASVEPPPEPPMDQTAEQAALFRNAVGTALDVDKQDSAVIAEVFTRKIIANRLQLARDFLSDGERLPLTGEINRRVIAFITKYKEALDLKTAPPTPPPSTVPAVPNAFRNSFERAHGALPGQWASPATPDSAAAQDQAPAPRSEALTGEAPAVASQAVQLPFPVIGTHEPQAQAAPPSHDEESPSLAPPPWAPAPVHSRRNQPTDPPAPPGRTVEQMPTIEENVRRSQEKNRTTLRGVAGYVFYGIATLAALSIMVAAILFSVNTATTNREVVERTVETSSQAARETTASTRELLQQLAGLHGGNKIPPGAMAGADGSLSLPRPMANAPAPVAAPTLPTTGMRCRPAPQPACGNLPIDTPMSATSGPGYECPASNGPIALGLRRGWDVCHCQYCE